MKLLDWQARWPEPEASENVFALVVMAQLRAKTSRDAEERSGWKFQLVRRLYERGYPREVVLELFRVMDWMMRLPEGLERRFLTAVYDLEETKKMPYVTSAERFGIEQGLQQGLEQGLRQGEVAVPLRLIERKYGPEAVTAYQNRVEQVDEVFH